MQKNHLLNSLGHMMATALAGFAPVKTVPSATVPKRKRYKVRTFRNPSKYMPHQGKQEKARRVRQMEKIND